MRKEVEINISSQAELMLSYMQGIDREDLINWFCNVRKISVGGGDVIDYLKSKNTTTKGVGN